MLFRFCLYGFLKNQRYFEPFLILAFLQKGLSFAAIGLLVGFRELCINLLEVPTGALADACGRRHAMILSFLAYIAAFAIFGFSKHFGSLLVAMVFFSIGEAFRTGTHKAMIFDWLARHGRQDEKVAVYGLTRSWSKLGSAVSVLIAAVVVFWVGDYSAVFFLSIVPYAANIVNFVGYPNYLDGPRHGDGGMMAVMSTLWLALKASVRSSRSRRLLVESMSYEGLFKTSKDYLQPLLQGAALAVPVLLHYNDRQRTAVIVGGVYFLLHLLSSVASRRAGRLVRKTQGEDASARLLWIANSIVFAVFVVGVLVGLPALGILAFLVLAVLQNYWRPIMISRWASQAPPEQMATVLSVESQAKSLFVAVMAPLLGWAVDAVTGHAADLRFLPVALLGVVISVIMIGRGRHRC